MAESDRATLVFHASLARSDREIRLHLADCLGEVGAALSRIREGLDTTDVIVRTMVTPVMMDLLARIERSPDTPLAAGLYIHLFQNLGAQQ